MKPYYQDKQVTIYNGDCRNVLAELPEQSVHCCVTNPPYFGLRDYGTAAWDGGDPNCDHQEYLGGHGEKSKKQVTSAGTQKYNYKDVCKKCGAKRTDSQIGLEYTPDDYVAEMVKVFRAVRRVLRDDGTLWLNLGDSYGALGGSTHAGFKERYFGSGNGGGKQSAAHNGMESHHVDTGLRPKNLLGIPWRVAFALQADGWYLRQDIIWHKPNPMPESVTDRCTKAHEYIFLLSKSPKYFYDADVIKDPVKQEWGTRDRTNGKYHSPGTGLQPHSGLEKSYEFANKRSVWTVNTKPYKGAHFAVFPSELINPCVMAGCPKDGTVLDPFGGSGTVAEVAKYNGRNAIAIELNEEYIALQMDRVSQGVLAL